MSDETDDFKENPDEDPMVPGDLLELHVALEEVDVSPEDFKKVYGK